uniref:Opsin 7, group member a n=1 Tax=Cyclopterus lumpus TaxID=8103 RepID=A0A8C2WHQ3_CYCLU
INTPNALGEKTFIWHQRVNNRPSPPLVCSVGVCSLLGNSTLLYVSYRKKYLLKPAEYFIINLAVSDLGLTLSLYPMAITSSFYHRWLYGRTVCSVYAFCGILFGICSLTTLTLLSTVCFVKVCYPLYGNRFNSAHGRLLIACAWVYALLFACSPLAHWGKYGPEPYGTACCIDWRLSNQHATARSYTVALFILCYILPCCVIVASYTSILVTVHASRKNIERHVSRQTHMSSIQTIIVKLSVAVCISFFAAWSPYAVVSMWAAFGHIENISPLAFALPAMFAKSSTIYNPIIYLMLRPNIQMLLNPDWCNFITSPSTEKNRNLSCDINKTGYFAIRLCIYVEKTSFGGFWRKTEHWKQYILFQFKRQRLKICLAFLDL